MKKTLSALVMMAMAWTTASAASADDIKLAQKTASAIELASMSLATAVRQGDRNDYRKHIDAPVAAHKWMRYPNCRSRAVWISFSAAQQVMNS